MKTRYIVLLSSMLGLAVAGPALAVCDVTLASVLPSNQAVLKADCGTASMTSITWTRDAGSVNPPPVTFGPFNFPATVADLNFTTLLTSGTHSYTASGIAGATPVGAGKAAVVTLSQPILTVAVSPGGSVTSSPLSTSIPIGISSCTNIGGVCAAGFDTGATVVLTPTAIGAYTFAGWGGDCAGNGNCTVSMTTLRTVTANFSSVPTFALNVSATGGAVNGNGIGCPGGLCSVNLTSGTAVSLTATPTPPNSIVTWSGRCSGNSNTCAFSMPATIATVGATFSAAPTYALHVNSTANGYVSGTGLSLCTVNSGDCDVTGLTSSTGPTLTATAQAGYVFNGWSGGGCTGNGPCTPTLTANTTTNVSATFGANPTYTLTVAPTAGGSVSGSGISSCTSTSGTCSVGPLASGTTLSLTATAAAGYVFNGWSGGGCSGTAGCSVTLTANTTVAANFGTVTTGSCGPGETMAAGDVIWTSTSFITTYLWPVPPVTGSGASGRAIQFVADSVRYPLGVELGGIDESQPSIVKDYVVSACPHSFVPVGGNSLCKKDDAGNTMGPMYLRFGPAMPRTWLGMPQPSLDCPLTPGGTYYINFRDGTGAGGGVSSQFVINYRFE